MLVIADNTPLRYLILLGYADILQVTLHEQSEVIPRKLQERGCFVLLTNVPTAGEIAHRARYVLRAHKEQHGIE
jgi:hypothetical protein